MSSGEAPEPFELREPEAGRLCVALAGDWSGERAALQDAKGRPAVGSLLLDEVGKRLGAGVSRIGFDTTGLAAWDSQLVVLVSRLEESAKRARVRVEHHGLPAGVCRLLRLARAVPPRGGRQQPDATQDVLQRVGSATIEAVGALGSLERFLGDSLLALGRCLRGQAQCQRSDVALLIQESGPQALPIVGVVNLLLGATLAFLGAVELQQIGAEIFVADMVALGQTREIAPMMTAIVMAGRTGAAYAAQLGAMQVNEEIDALRTFGFSPIDYLVLPRMLALALMMPLLVLYGDALGILGGYLVGSGVLDLATSEYVSQTRSVLALKDVMLGITKAAVFGILVALTGCWQGLRSGRSASAVGDAATRAVVTAIVSIIVTTALFAVITNILEI